MWMKGQRQMDVFANKRPANACVWWRVTDDMLADGWMGGWRAWEGRGGRFIGDGLKPHRWVIDDIDDTEEKEEEDKVAA